MKRALYASILLLSYIVYNIEAFESVSSKTSRSDNSNKTVAKERRPKLKLYGNNVDRLQSLQAHISEFVATYDRPFSTPEPRTFMHFRKRLKRLPPLSTRAHQNRNRTTKIPRNASYVHKKTYPSMADRRGLHYAHFLKIFSFNNDTMKEKLLAMSDKIKQDMRDWPPCLVDTYLAFKEHCSYLYYSYGGLMQMRSLLTKTCSAGWLTPEQIIHVLRGCCQQQFKYKVFDLKIVN